MGGGLSIIAAGPLFVSVSSEDAPACMRSLELDSGAFVVGALRAVAHAPHAAATFVYWRYRDMWRQEAKLKASTGAGRDTFGNWVVKHTSQAVRRQSQRSTARFEVDVARSLLLEVPFHAYLRPRLQSHSRHETNRRHASLDH